MSRFEYEITSHPAEAFKELVYFCSSVGECNLQQIPSDQTKIMQTILNERGRNGWELVQATFGKGGILVFWKRMIKDDEKEKEEIIEVF